MKLPLRIIVPIALAIVASGFIGAIFLWQINASVHTIESSFQSQRGSSILEKIVPGTMTRTRSVPQNQSQALMSLRQGEIFEMKGEWKRAEEKYQESVSAGGGVSALRRLAGIQLQRREFDVATKTIKQLSADVRDQSSILLLQGLLELRQGNTSRAEKIFNRDAEIPESLYGLALVAIAKGDHDGATVVLDRAMQGTDPTIKAYAGTLMRAYQEFALFPDGQEIHRQTLVAHALAETGECELALTLVNAVVTVQSRYRDAWIVKGYCEFATERLKDGLTSLEQAYALDPEKAETQYFLARVHSALGDPQNAVTFLQYAIINGFEPEKDARSLLADYAKELGNTDLALEQLQILAKAPSSTIDAFVQYVSLALSLQNHAPSAYELAKEAVKRWPNDSTALALAGKTALASGLPNDAKKYVDASLAIDPQNAEALKVQGELRK